MKNTKKVAFIIGRFQIVHAGHIALINRANEIADQVVIIVGSINKPRTIKDPFTFEERQSMLAPQLGGWRNYSTQILGVPDSAYNDAEWVHNIQTSIFEIVGNDNDVVLVGHEKDESSFYLKMFPQWDYENVDRVGENISATEYRNNLFEGKHSFDLPKKTQTFLIEFRKTDAYTNLVQEYNFIKGYKQSWEDAPYAPTFVTADAVVVQSGHILLVKRRAAPGKGLWAFPGGFVNQQEKIFDACIRELREETKLKVPDPVLRGSLRMSRVFDDPDRSLRGRTITHAFLFNLAPSNILPVVKGADDAEKAKWIPLHEFFNMRGQMFEDHYDIGTNLIGTL